MHMLFCAIQMGSIMLMGLTGALLPVACIFAILLKASCTDNCTINAVYASHRRLLF